MTKFCKDCHWRGSAILGMGIAITCHAPQAKKLGEPDLETGKLKQVGFITCGYNRMYSDCCGKKARWFKPKWSFAETMRKLMRKRSEPI